MLAPDVGRRALTNGNDPGHRNGRHYVGRFAPRLPGPLHLGSIVAALGSWLDARAPVDAGCCGSRTRSAARARGRRRQIRRQLRGLGLRWDDEVARAIDPRRALSRGLARLEDRGLVYGCRARAGMRVIGLASRRAENRSIRGRVGISGCSALPAGPPARVRWRLPDGRSCASPTAARARRNSGRRREAGDQVLRRADGHWAYQFAVVVDDGDDGVSESSAAATCSPTPVARSCSSRPSGCHIRAICICRWSPMPRAQTVEARGRRGRRGLTDPVATLASAAAVARDWPVGGALLRATGRWLVGQSMRGGIC